MMQLVEGNLIAEHYKLVKQLGRGSFGEVWLAHNLLADIDVAIKFYGTFDMKGLDEFRSEFKLAYKLHHPNLLNISHFDVCDNCPFLVMPYCANGSVSRQTGKMSEADIWKFASDVSAGLAFLHSQHPPIIHQDIKPDNILITADGRYVISDFGISRNLRTKMSSVNNSGSSGTIAYMGPERFSTSPVVVLASDVWAFGMTLYELMSGDVMWEGMGGCAQLNGALLPTVDQRFSPQLSRLVTACLASQTWNRPTAEQVHAYADAYLHHQALPPLTPHGTSSVAEAVQVQQKPVQPDPVQPIPVEPVRIKPTADQPSRAESYVHSSTNREASSDSLLPAGLTMKRLLVGVAALLVAAMLITGATMFFSSVREEQRFVSCKTLQDYQQFIADYPNSSYVETARKRIADMTPASKQNPVVKDEAPAGVQQPITNNAPANIQQTVVEHTVAPAISASKPSTASQRPTSRQAYSASADDAAFYSCVTSNDFNNYLAQFPNGRHRQQALQTLNTLANSKRDNAAPANDANGANIVNSDPVGTRSVSSSSSVSIQFSSPSPGYHSGYHSGPRSGPQPGSRPAPRPGSGPHPGSAPRPRR